ncbi:hypothetical protein Y032_0369g85 [Ancylostoma ceylanicum]|uniref:Uncharacterized protein n=1 Tax=Ancylostoma ceylanicum TaxID=53326 RepID=A0A016RUN3_9BILA|nr:hypothetical protein Y032_0369g85 [Ancylostoma ceylanicum]
MAIMGRMPIDCHAPLIIIPLSSEVSLFTLSMWRPPAVVAIATIAREVWGYSKARTRLDGEQRWGAKLVIFKQIDTEMKTN